MSMKKLIEQRIEQNGLADLSRFCWVEKTTEGWRSYGYSINGIIR